jgi:hypothetical protein
LSLAGDKTPTLSWSPDGATILAVLYQPEISGAKPAGQTSVVTFPAAGGAPTTLLPAVPLTGRYAAAYYSPDGTSFVVGTIGGLSVASADGAGLHQILANTGVPTGWSLQPPDQASSLLSGSPGYDQVAGDGGTVQLPHPVLRITRLRHPRRSDRRVCLHPGRPRLLAGRGRRRGVQLR